MVARTFRLTLILALALSGGLIAVSDAHSLGGTIERVSLTDNGKEANDGSRQPSISANGQFVSYISSATNLVTGNTLQVNVFVHDRESGSVAFIDVDSDGNEGNNDSFEPDLSADGRVIAFFSPASNLVPNDLNGVDDVFLFDLGPQPVGGIAELPEVAEAALEAESSSGLSAGALAATAAGAVAGGLALGSVAWYVKRRGRYASLL